MKNIVQKLYLAQIDENYIVYLKLNILFIVGEEWIKKMKKTKYIFAAVAMLLLLIVISNPEWKSKKNNFQDKDRNIEIETQNLIEEKTGAYQGFYGRSYQIWK